MKPPQEELTFYRCGDLPGIEFLSTRNTRRLWKIFHLTYTFCTQAKNSAAAEYDYRGKMALAPPDELMALEPGEVHTVRKTFGMGHFDVMFVDPALVRRLAPELHLRESAVHWRSPQAGGSMLVAAFRRLHESVSTSSSALERQSRFLACLRRMTEHNAERTPRSMPTGAESLAVRKARDLIVDCYDENLSLEKVASCAGLTYFNLLHKFKERYGIPPHAFQLQVRLARAREYLAQGIPPAIVAARTGFSDQSHLHRNFKRSFGITLAQVPRRITTVI